MKKRNIRRKRKRLKRLVLILLLLIIILFLLVKKEVIRGLGENDVVNEFQKQVEDILLNDDSTDEETVETVSKYEYIAPRELSVAQIKEELMKLSDSYSEFKEIYDNMDAYPNDLLKALCNNPDMIDFVKGYINADTKKSGTLTEKELNEEIPSLIQWDTRWGYLPYGDDNIALSGCAPTCLAMVIVGLTGDESVTPATVAEYATDNDYYLVGTGTKWSIMTDGCLDFGVKSKVISLSKEIVFSELENGHPIICSMRQGDFTTGGHFIVLTAVEDGKIAVNDPNSKVRSNMLWDYETLEPQIKNLWSFQKKGKKGKKAQ